MSDPRPRRALRLAAIAVAIICGVALSGPALAASAAPSVARPVKKVGLTTVVENWAGAPTSSQSTPSQSAPFQSTSFHAASPVTRLIVVPAAGALDGQALKLQLNAHPDAGPSGGALISSNQLYRYGVFGSRLKTADCTGQNHPGVITGTFTYSTDHADTNKNGVSDNDEIDIEFLCAQPDVAYLTIWTDYSETSNNLREITRTINLRTGKVLSNCYIVSYGTGCRPPLAGENSPAGVPPIPGFSSDKQFRTYWFDWQPDHVTFYASDNVGRTLVLWDYRGPKSRIPGKPSSFMQNVTYTKAWDPLTGGPANQPTADTPAYIDSTSINATAVPGTGL